jgi:hypothetical protein
MENKTGSPTEAPAKVRKYLKYAIGEIILVVIGILLALQINNWNEARKAKIKEVEFLKDFQRELQFDILQIDSLFNQYNRSKVAINKLLNHLDEDLPYSDSLDYYFFDTTLVYDSGGLTDGTYETLKSAGFDVITNKEIRDLIVMVYEEFNPWMNSWEQRYINLIFDAKSNLFNSRFRDSWNGNYKDREVIGTMKPLNYEALKQDNEFKYYLRTQLNDMGWLVNKPSENTQIECKKLLTLIETELSTID